LLLSSRRLLLATFFSCPNLLRRPRRFFVHFGCACYVLRPDSLPFSLPPSRPDLVGEFQQTEKPPSPPTVRFWSTCASPAHPTTFHLFFTDWRRETMRWKAERRLRCLADNFQTGFCVSFCFYLPSTPLPRVRFMLERERKRIPLSFDLLTVPTRRDAHTYHAFPH
jgi:hypothetical protein